MPIGLGITKTTVFNRRPMNIGLQYYHNVVHPDTRTVRPGAHHHRAAVSDGAQAGRQEVAMPTTGPSDPFGTGPVPGTAARAASAVRGGGGDRAAGGHCGAGGLGATGCPGAAAGTRHRYRSRDCAAGFRRLRAIPGGRAAAGLAEGQTRTGCSAMLGHFTDTRLIPAGARMRASRACSHRRAGSCPRRSALLVIVALAFALTLASARRRAQCGAATGRSSTATGQPGGVVRGLVAPAREPAAVHVAGAYLVLAALPLDALHATHRAHEGADRRLPSGQGRWAWLPGAVAARVPDPGLRARQRRGRDAGQPGDPRGARRRRHSRRWSSPP